MLDIFAGPTLLAPPLAAKEGKLARTSALPTRKASNAAGTPLCPRAIISSARILPQPFSHRPVTGRLPSGRYLVTGRADHFNTNFH